MKRKFILVEVETTESNVALARFAKKQLEAVVSVHVMQVHVNTAKARK